MKKATSSFSGQLGFVLASAASAVGLGNIWRFPYFAAKDGGGIFIFIYLLIVATFGFTMLVTEISIGRKLHKSAVKAYSELKKSWSFLGYIGCLVPLIIFPYYCVIGGWVTKYLLVFLAGDYLASSQGNYFTDFITGQAEPIVMTLVFLACTAFIVFRGVNKGIESSSRYLMPLLLVMVILIAGYSLTLSYQDGNATRTGLDGLGYCLIPNLEGYTVQHLLSVIMDAVGQSFFSISVSMGIMITYGSYMRSDSHLTRSVDQILVFDTVVAILAAVMIIPTVYVFMGTEGLSTAGPGLIFVALPKVFLQMGEIGHYVGLLFFALVFFAALTSCVSILEAIVANIMEVAKTKRSTAVAVQSVFGFLLAVVVCLGYNVFYFEATLPNGSTGQILDIFDFVSNTLLMPLAGLLTCILIGWILKPQVIIEEVTRNGERFCRRGIYVLILKYIAPVFLAVLLINSTGILN